MIKLYYKSEDEANLYKKLAISESKKAFEINSLTSETNGAVSDYNRRLCSLKKSDGPESNSKKLKSRFVPIKTENSIFYTLQLTSLMV